MNIGDNIQQENNIIVSNELILQKQFQHLNIKVYGTFENPLFKAKDIGDLLEIKNVREIIKNYNNKQRCDVSLTDAIGREQETIFLTEQGLYKILMRSRKPIAEQFQDWVCEVIGEIRLNSTKKLEEKLNYQEKQLSYYKELHLNRLILMKHLMFFLQILMGYIKLEKLISLQLKNVLNNFKLLV
jgi:prophage antirepressor-like protein